MNEPTCFDLRPWADANRYRWRWEESRQPGENDAFLVEVLCKHGLIYPKGGETLLAYAGRGVKRHLSGLGFELHQIDGDAEVFRFPANRLDEVAAILKPRKRRTLDPDRARAIGKASQYGAQGGQEFEEATQDAD